MTSDYPEQGKIPEKPRNGEYQRETSNEAGIQQDGETKLIDPYRIFLKEQEIKFI